MDAALPADENPSAESILRSLKGAAAGSDSPLPSPSVLRAVLDALKYEASRTGDSVDGLSAESYDASESFGRFQVERELGRGGFGWVFLSRDPTLNRPVALKVPRPELSVSEQFRRDLIAEAETAALLDHPNIVPVYEAGECGPLVYIVSAYCDGPTLGQWLHEQGSKTDARRAALITVCLADALAHAHQRGILHRDIKPSNILLQAADVACRDELPFTPRLTDFGLALRLDSLSPRPLAGPVGTPRYMAPEQLSGSVVTAAADIYGIGAVLYEMLCGQPPAGFDPEQVHDEAVLEHLRKTGSPLDLAAICGKCLALEPEQRYGTAEALGADVRRFLAGVPVSARPVRFPVRAARWCRRNPALASALLLVVAVATGGALGINMLRHRAQQHAVASSLAKVEASEHLQHAQTALVELAWLVEESTLWELNDRSARHALQKRLYDYHQQCVAKGVDDDATRAVKAAMHSFKARNAALHGSQQEAEAEFQAALKRWRELVRSRPEDASHFRAMVRVAVAYWEFSTPPERDTSAIVALIAAPDLTPGWSEQDVLAILSVRLAVVSDLATGHLSRNERGRANLFYRCAADLLGAIADIERDEPLHRLRQVQILWAIRGYRGSRPEEVQEARTEAMAILEELLQDHPDNDTCRAELAELYRLQATGRHERHERELAREGYYTAIALADDVLSRDPTNTRARSTVAATARRLAAMEYKAGNKQAAIDLISRTCDIWDEYFVAGVLPNEYFGRLALAWHDLGTWARETAQQERSKKAYRRGVAVFRAHAEIASMSRLDWLCYAECLVRTGDHQQTAGDTVEAMQSYEAARAILQRMATNKQVAEPAVWARLHSLRERIAKLQGVALDPSPQPR